ncbi:MAG: peptide chain release factor N(5)-glutamine methyltransferase [Peptococcaceae bacterium]|nr:peptide chain release factor N(5)-glutamine methyltransferase [Peptococcaceae bacterium]MBO5429199.1 peptide chain release factor N(5)-glutamine methyltransferase [Peptococcaceae bacterium]MBP3341088.1 peptide chain release factor N(5)-glutamine methyltransferase [Peptococcaceae bacterium]MBP3624816.1 peptide chain release factor N(5)-glutamine methyltransferase [Peptococcaceae bacterium]MBR2009776.1 peptide chain release factor N(5)-glutamine methyltransferase [Peptococcaceae bacterium]
MKTACTNKEILQWAIAELGKENRMEAELLLCHVLDTNRALLLAHDTDSIGADKAEAYRTLVARRKAGEPFQYLLGSANFMGLDFIVTPDVLIPRFDTERLVEKALELLQPIARPIVLDICTGSGAIAVAISHYKPDAAVYAGDISEAALKVAEQNNQCLNTHVSFRQGNLLEPFDDLNGTVHLLISNPPYITTQEMQELPIDVQQEPHLALWGGEDGLDFYRILSAKAPLLLCAGGWLMFEIGWKQGAAVSSLMQQQGFQNVAVLQDWQGNDRVVVGQMKL